MNKEVKIYTPPHHNAYQIIGFSWPVAGFDLNCPLIRNNFAFVIILFDHFPKIIIFYFLYLINLPPYIFDISKFGFKKTLVLAFLKQIKKFLLMTQDDLWWHKMTFNAIR